MSEGRQKKSGNSVHISITFREEVFNFILAEAQCNNISFSAQVNMMLHKLMEAQRERG